MNHQAMLNKRFRGAKKFKFVCDQFSDNAYQSGKYRIELVSGDIFALFFNNYDLDTGGYIMDEVFCGHLLQCVEVIRSDMDGESAPFLKRIRRHRSDVK